MSKIINELKNWFDEVYKNNNHIACIELPILKILNENNDWTHREDIIKKLKKFGDFKRGNLSFDHLWSQRFTRGEESKLLNKLVIHDAEKSGDIKNKYKIKDEVKKDLTLFIQKNQYDEKSLIEKRLKYVSNDNNDKTKKENRKNYLNQILCGPPGTGKTYDTINKALEIIFEK